MPEKQDICFVIMPFSKTTDIHTEEYWTDHFSLFLKPLIEENPRLEARRSQALRGDILKQIITDLVISLVVVVDLTDSNPNVYWELGVRQSFKHCTVTIAEAGTKLPSDIGGKGTLFYYPDNYLKLEEFRRQFKLAINDCLANPNRPDSYVLETISGRGTLFEIFRQEEARRRLDALLSECEKNLSVLQNVKKRCEENQKDSSKRSYTTSRLKTPALELLVTNRYIEETPTFFALADSLLSDIIMINDQLSLWEYNPDGTEKWFLKYIGSSVKKLEKFKSSVTGVYSKIIKII